MKFSVHKDHPQIDAVAEEDDMVDIRIYESAGRGMGQNLVVDVNGISILRIGNLKQEIEIQRES